jgi:hypothetical protein
LHSETGCVRSYAVISTRIFVTGVCSAVALWDAEGTMSMYPPFSVTVSLNLTPDVHFVAILNPPPSLSRYRKEQNGGTVLPH